MIEPEPCPKCKMRTKLALKSGFEPNSLVIECENCEYVMFLESKLPIDAEEIIKEWNRRVADV